MSIKILNFKRVNEKYKKAVFSIQIPEWGNLILNFCTLYCKNGREWINLPSRRGDEKNGEGIYTPYLALSREIEDRLKGATKEALKQLINDADSDLGS
ncbi:MAG: hypothetical protein ACE5GV_00240 [Candidatus Scalindua sp.]